MLFAASPLYVFVSRLFMIESTALFLSLTYADQMLGFVERDSRWRSRYIAGAAAAGALAGLVKVTTFAPYFVLGSCLVAWALWKVRYDWATEGKKAVIAILLCLAFPVSITWTWTRFADDVKQQNPFGVYLTSRALHDWTFGPLAERFHPRVYLQLFYAADNQAGSILACVLVVVSYLWLFRRWDRVALYCLSLYVFTILLFFNLHVVHEYYPYSNAVFLIIAMGY